MPTPRVRKFWPKGICILLPGSETKYDLSLSPELPSLPLMRIINVDYFTNQLMYTVGQICLYFIFFHFFFCFTLLFLFHPWCFFLNVEAVTGQPDVFQGFQEYIIKLLRHLLQIKNCASRFPRDRFSAWSDISNALSSYWNITTTNTPVITFFNELIVHSNRPKQTWAVHYNEPIWVLNADLESSGISNSL